MPTKIYLASSFRYKLEVINLKGKLQDLGYEITCEWWHTDYKTFLPEIGKTISDNNKSWWANSILKVIYRRTFEAIKESEILIFVTPEEGKYNGANVEVGIALALGKHVIAYGKLERSGMYEPLIRCSDLEELTRALKEFEV